MMKKLSLILLILTATIACKDSNDRQEKNPSDVSEEKTKNKKHQKSAENYAGFERKDACKIVLVEDVAQIMNWNAADITSSAMMTLENYKNLTNCEFINTVTAERVTVRFAWKNANGQKNKVLEQQFAKFVENGSNNFDYSPMPNDGDASEVILGKNSARGYNYLHLKMRYDNVLEVSGEITTNDQSDMDRYATQLYRLLQNAKS